MRSLLRWLFLATLAVCGLLAQVTRYQNAEIDRLREAATRRQQIIAELETELAGLRVETGVRNVLEAHDINVPRHKQRLIAQSIIEASQHFGVEPELILAVIFAESRFDVYATSPKGAVGLMQLMPATALAVADELQLEWKGQRLLTDPQINILIGTSYLRHLMRLYHEQGLDYALAAYNVGPRRLDHLVERRGRFPAGYAETVREVSEELKRRFF